MNIEYIHEHVPVLSNVDEHICLKVIFAAKGSLIYIVLTLRMVHRIKLLLHEKILMNKITVIHSSK